MSGGEDKRMALRWIAGRPVETILLVFGIALGIGATAAGIALAGRAAEESRKVLSSTRYREIVVTVRESAEEMDRPAEVRLTGTNVILTTADLAARDEVPDIRHAYVADMTNLPFGNTPGFDRPGAPGGGSGGPGGMPAGAADGAQDMPGMGSAPPDDGGMMQPPDGEGPPDGMPGGPDGQVPPGMENRPEEVALPEGTPTPAIEEARGYQVSPEFFAAWNMSASEGSLFTLPDVARGEPLLVLGSKLAATIYEDGKPLGRQILSRRQLYRVTGILEPTGTDYDSMAFVPAVMAELSGRDAFARRFERFNATLHFAVADSNRLEQARAQLETWFAGKYGEGRVVITVPRAEAEATRDRNGRLVAVILFLAVSALLIAAANVTNILFGRALRKRRAVGILKALGASDAAVFRLFFLEAALIGAGGALAGTGLSVVLSLLMQKAMGFGGVAAGFLALGVLGATVLVTALEVFPALQAARVPAAEAIRYE